MDTFTVHVGKGKTNVHLEVKILGNDASVLIWGGDEPHIGGFTWIHSCNNHKLCRTVSFGNHKDHHLFSIIWDKLQKTSIDKILITGGIHVKNATKEHINVILENTRIAAQKLIEALLDNGF